MYSIPLCTCSNAPEPEYTLVREPDDDSEVPEYLVMEVKLPKVVKNNLLYIWNLQKVHMYCGSICEEPKALREIKENEY